jgi:hypothetical protein
MGDKVGLESFSYTSKVLLDRYPPQMLKELKLSANQEVGMDGNFLRTFSAFPWISKFFLFQSSHSEKLSRSQGCQIFLGTTYQNVGKYIPNAHKIY